jgi:hypothetical protein
MGLETKEVAMSLHGVNIQYYESLGYKIPRYKNINNRLVVKRGTKIWVKVEDILDGANIKVDVKCDGCCKETKKIFWQCYKKCVKEDGKYFCNSCALKLYGGKSISQTRLKNGKSFEHWCIEKSRQDVLDRWDYELNKINPNEIAFATNKKYYFKCPKGIHQSELKRITGFTNNKNSTMDCDQCHSFAQWCINNNYLNILERWDFELNKCKPIEVNYCTCQKYYFKCPKGIHKSELKNINGFTSGQEGSMYCNACNSFAQWGIDNICEDFLRNIGIGTKIMN